LLTKLLIYLTAYLHVYLFTHLLPPWSRVLLKKLIGSELLKEFPVFYETEGSLPNLQVPATHSMTN